MFGDATTARKAGRAMMIVPGVVPTGKTVDTGVGTVRDSVPE